MNWSIKLLEYRKKTLFTQKDLAEILNVSVICISHWENKVNKPTNKNKNKLMVLFNEAGIKNIE